MPKWLSAGLLFVVRVTLLRPYQKLLQSARENGGHGLGVILRRINLIWSRLVDKATLERLTACMRLTASQYNRQ